MKASFLPAPLAAAVEGVDVVAVGKTAGTVIAGIAAEEIGGAVLKVIPQVESLAAQNAFADAGVHLAGGLALDAIGAGGFYLATKNKARTGQVAGLLAVGTVVGSTRPIVMKGIDQAVTQATAFVAKLMGRSTAALAAPSSAQAPAGVGGLRDFSGAVGGLVDFSGNVGGTMDEGLSAWG